MSANDDYGLLRHSIDSNIKHLESIYHKLIINNNDKTPFNRRSNLYNYIRKDIMKSYQEYKKYQILTGRQKTPTEFNKELLRIIPICNDFLNNKD